MYNTPQFGIFSFVCCIFVSFLITLPWSGPIAALDNTTNYRIPIPTNNLTCTIASQSNTSLQLAYVDCGVAFVLASFCLVYILSPKKGTAWPLEILWTASFLIFALEITVFCVIVARLSVWFLSCNNAANLEGACPTTRFRQLRQDITDIEQCYFDANTLTVYNAENDQFTSCQETSALANYNKRFARWDVPAYYSAAALCLREEVSTNLAWCFYYGCDPVCNAPTYLLNLKWFILDVLLLFSVLATHMITFGNFYIVRGDVKDE